MRLANSETTAQTILIVEECGPLCELMEIILTRSGYRVFTATDASQALQTARDIQNIDLLICHFELPGMRGDELAGEFTDYQPFAAVLFLRSTCDWERTANTYDAIEKPFDAVALRRSVWRNLNASSANGPEMAARNCDGAEADVRPQSPARRGPTLFEFFAEQPTVTDELLNA